ncbi:MAG: c-type cytochrome [Myxococcales bacterium]|nr:c-type cytochrome [Myxococcales bacterium]
MSRDTNELTDHDYDGITEYDNPLPRWWLMLFYGGIVFAAVYIPWYHFGPGPLMVEEYEAQMAAAAAAMPQKKGPDAAALATAQKDPARLAAGKETFARLCVACHTADGGGLVGPNLTDDYWIHGGSMADVVHVITEGVPEKGMISWKTQLKDDEIVSVAAYVKSLRGTTPANPKAPEGEKYEGD